MCGVDTKNVTVADRRAGEQSRRYIFIEFELQIVFEQIDDRSGVRVGCSKCGACG
jgi:hypothetical protein